MPKRKKADGYSFLTAAGALGANLIPSIRVLMLLEDTRAAAFEWLRGRAAALDPVVAAYLDLDHLSTSDWSDFKFRLELLDILDRQNPTLPRRPKLTTRLVLRSPKGWWAWGQFVADPRLARQYDDIGRCSHDLLTLADEAGPVVPEFCPSEDLWRGIPPRESAPDPDPWGAALRECRTVPGCSWVPIPPDRREHLERVIRVKCLVRDEAVFEDVLRAAARFGHPLYTVYADLARRQRWAGAFQTELLDLDARHAKYRDPPGDVPTLQVWAGPDFVVVSREGFWTGSGWSKNYEDAVRFPAFDWRLDEAVEAERVRAEELTGVRGVTATVDTHPVQPQERAGRRGLHRRAVDSG